MALYPLAGPFPMLDHNGAAVGLLHNPGHGGHYPGIGFLITVPMFGIGGSYWTARLSLDGVVEILSSQGHNGLFLWEDVNRILVVDNNVWEPVALCESPYTSYPTRLPYSTVWSPFSNPNAAMVGAGLLVGVPTPPGWAGNGFTLGPGRKPGELFMGMTDNSGGSDSQCFFYDTNSHTQSSQTFHLGEGARMVVYDSDHNLILSITDNPVWALKIWSLEVVPSNLSAITVQSGNPASGGLVTYKVQVLGAQGDFCESILVDWSLVSGPGTLIDTQTTTDSKGVATCRVLYSGAGGTSVPEASVTC